MKTHHNFLVLTFLTLPFDLCAAEVSAVSPTGGVLKMVFGLAVVLAVMALITWLLKRVMPSVGNKQSVVRVVGGVSVGSRERVVVVEVAGRWIVVGVAPGQVNRLANLEIGAAHLLGDMPNSNQHHSNQHLGSSHGMDADAATFTNTFAQWLTKSTGKILDKKDVNN